MKNDTDSTLAKLGYKVLRNFDFALAGLCLTFAVASRPFYTGIYEERLQNAKTQYAEVYQTADSVYRAEKGVSAPNDSTLNMHLYNRREKDDTAYDLSYEFQNARAEKYRAQDAYDFGRTFGSISGGAFAALGVVAAGAGIASRRRDKKGPAAP